MNSPVGSILTMPVSMPCSSTSRSWRCRPEADPVGDHVGDRRQHQQRDAAAPGHRVQRDVERLGDQVVAAGQEQHQVERDRHAPSDGADRDVARALQQMVRPRVLGHPGFDERIRRGQGEQDRRAARPSARTAAGWCGPNSRDLPGREQTGRAVQEHHVPVRLRAGGHLRGVVRAEQPHRVDLREPAERGAARRRR